ncbi:hypothetical protein LINPERHAP2_LOCUS31765 [Linum perenne]
MEDRGTLSRPPAVAGGFRPVHGLTLTHPRLGSAFGIAPGILHGDVPTSNRGQDWYPRPHRPYHACYEDR